MQRTVVTRGIRWVALFAVVAGVTWAVLAALVPWTYTAAGVVELGYFNPRDYLPHPIVSAQGLVASLADPSLGARIQAEVGGWVQLRAAPLEQGLLHIEARSKQPGLARRAAAMACSLVVARANEPYEREQSLVARQLASLALHLSWADSLIEDPRVPPEAKAQALRAAAHLAEVLVETETHGELVAQKKQTRLLVAPAAEARERPALPLLALGPAACLVAVAAAMRRR